MFTQPRIAASIAALLCLSAGSLRAQTDEEIRAQTSQLQAEILAARRASDERLRIQGEMDMLQTQIAVLDACLAKAASGHFIGFGWLSCYPVDKESFKRALLIELFSGRLKENEVAEKVVKAVQDSRRNVAAIRLARVDLAKQLNDARNRWASIRTPSRSDFSGSSPTPPAPRAPDPQRQAAAPKDYGPLGPHFCCSWTHPALANPTCGPMQQPARCTDQPNGKVFNNHYCHAHTARCTPIGQ